MLFCFQLTAGEDREQEYVGCWHNGPTCGMSAQLHSHPELPSGWFSKGSV